MSTNARVYLACLIEVEVGAIFLQDLISEQLFLAIKLSVLWT